MRCTVRNACRLGHSRGACRNLTQGQTRRAIKTDSMIARKKEGVGIRSFSACVSQGTDRRGRSNNRRRRQKLGQVECRVGWTIRAERPDRSAGRGTGGGTFSPPEERCGRESAVRLRGKKHAIVETDPLKRAGDTVDPHLARHTTFFRLSAFFFPY